MRVVVRFAMGAVTVEGDKGSETAIEALAAALRQAGLSVAQFGTRGITAEAPHGDVRKLAGQVRRYLAAGGVVEVEIVE